MTTCLEANVSVLIVHIQIRCVKTQLQGRQRKWDHVRSGPRTLEADIWLFVGDIQRTQYKSRCNIASLQWVDTARTHSKQLEKQSQTEISARQYYRNRRTALVTSATTDKSWQFYLVISLQHTSLVCTIQSFFWEGRGGRTTTFLSGRKTNIDSLTYSRPGIFIGRMRAISTARPTEQNTDRTND